MKRALGLVVSSVVVLGLVGCGQESPPAAADDGPTVVAAFYPLQYVGDRITGRQVLSLTRPGAEPHDLELRPRDVATATEADLLVYVRGFQPAVDDVAGRLGGRAFDVSPAAGLDLKAPEGDEHAEEHAGEHTDEAAGAHADEPTDPHFWLDPTKLAAVAQAVADRLAQADPAGADGYRQRAAALRAELTDLDAAFRSGLARCESRDLVTGHAAFGYLARRYDLRQRAVSGLDPSAEPSSGDLARVARFVRENKVRTVYTETLANPALARTVASAGGAGTAVLDPLEGLTDESAGRDYLSVMRANLAVLRKGQGCT